MPLKVLMPFLNRHEHNVQYQLSRQQGARLAEKGGGAHGPLTEDPSAVPDPTLKNFICSHLRFSCRTQSHYKVTMIQRILLRQSRALASCRKSAYPLNPLIRSQLRPANAAFAPVSRQIAATRFYATEPQAKADGEAAAPESNGKDNGENGTGEVEDPLKKELEAKNKEIIDLKVCTRTKKKCRRLTTI